MRSLKLLPPAVNWVVMGKGLIELVACRTVWQHVFVEFCDAQTLHVDNLMQGNRLGFLLCFFHCQLYFQEFLIVMYESWILHSS